MTTINETTNETEQPATIHPILAILKEAQDELMAQGERYENLRWKQYVPQATKERALYALDAQMRLLQGIIDKAEQVPVMEAEETIRQLQEDVERLRRQRDAQVVSVEMLHDAFIYAISAHTRSSLSAKEQVMYTRMAEHLNDALLLRAACSEPGYVWSSEAAEYGISLKEPSDNDFPLVFSAALRESAKTFVCDPLSREYIARLEEVARRAHLYWGVMDGAHDSGQQDAGANLRDALIKVDCLD